MNKASDKTTDSGPEPEGERLGLVFNIQKFAVHDGPGIRTTVFFKGCPLRCRWCANAESMHPKPELGFIRSICDGCGRCIEVCPEGAIGLSDTGTVTIDRDRCSVCGKCVEVCGPNALTVYGKRYSAAEVLEKVLRDKAFYDGSGGGITASGGEPLLQADFVSMLFRMSREAGLHTCLDTCGCASPETIKKVLEYTDFVLFDLKQMDPDVHRLSPAGPMTRSWPMPGSLHRVERACCSGCPWSKG